MDALHGHKALSVAGACVVLGLALIAPMIRSAWKKEPIALVRKWILIAAACLGFSLFVAAARIAHAGLSTLAPEPVLAAEPAQPPAPIDAGATD